jgi:Protein of unknown function (DUF2950)
MIRAALFSAALVLASGACVEAASYASPEAASAALAAAVAKNDVGAIESALGPGSHRLVQSGDAVADKAGRAAFTAAYQAKHAIAPKGGAAILVIGADDFPFPIPLRRHGDTWSFDVKAGAQEIIDRRIGRDELNAIDVCRAIVDAERDYAGEFAEYAQKFVSDPGKKNGLYWPAAQGPESPLGPLVTSARAQGYNGRHEPYHGYFYKLLLAQGPHAADGARDYVVGGRMIGGFAVVAYPANWGNTGVMSFMVNQDGTVLERNLGRGTGAIAAALTRYDPDPDWKAVK